MSVVNQPLSAQSIPLSSRVISKDHGDYSVMTGAARASIGVFFYDANNGPVKEIAV